MRASAPLILAASVLAAPVGAAEAPAAQRPPVIDPEIQAIVGDVSAERIQRSIYVLASFKTRQTLSDPLPSGDGIGGAASWIHAEFDRISKESAPGRRPGHLRAAARAAAHNQEGRDNQHRGDPSGDGPEPAGPRHKRAL
jgi:hypothetical protein